MATFDCLVDQRIVEVMISVVDHETLVFRDIKGQLYVFCTQNDCCNTVWFNHVTGVECLGSPDNVFDRLRGARVIATQDKGWGENRTDEQDHEVVQDGFWTIRTDRGWIDIEVRNSHNGYYGGQVIYAGNDLTSLEDFRTITQDF